MNDPSKTPEFDGKVFACIDESPLGFSVCDAASWISKTIGADLCFLHILEKTEVEDNEDLSGAIGIGSREVLLEKMVQVEEMKNRLAMEEGKILLEGAKERCEKAGTLNISMRQRHGNLAETAVDLQDEIRVWVMGRSGQMHKNEVHAIGSQLENVIRALHEPIFVVLKNFQIPTKPMFAFDGSKTSIKALVRVAKSPLLKGLPIHLVMVGVDSASSRNTLAEGEGLLAQEGFEVTPSLVQGEVQPALDEYRKQNGNDLLIMGAYGHSRIRQFFVGSTTTEMMRLSEIPLLLLR